MLYEDALLPKECGCHLTSDCLSSGGDVSRVRRGSQAWKSMSDDSMGIRKPPREDYLVAHIRRNYIHSVKINKKQNPKKCTFGATEGMFLGYLIEPDGIKPCPEKTKAVIQLPSPRTMKEVQSLNGKLAGLNRFLSKSADKSLPLFKTLKKCTKKGDFRWTTECRRSYSRLWYPKDSPFDLEAYIDSDYVGASLDRKSTTGGCQFLGSRLISWQCKKQTVVVNSTTQAEYVATSNCCGQVLWIQNQLLDYGYNFMNTKISIDNESTIYIVKNLVFHSKTKHIEIRHNFIKDSYEKRLIQVIKIHTNHNVADLLTKAFDIDDWNGLEMLRMKLGLKLTATVRTVDNEEQEITATVDGKEFTITEASVMRHLQLADVDGICVLPILLNFFDQLSLMGFKTSLVPQPPPSTAQPTNEEPIPSVVSSSHQKTQTPRQALNKVTELPQNSEPIPNVIDKVVYEEWDDRVERSTTTAGSLDAEHASGAKMPYRGFHLLRLGLSGYTPPCDSPLPRVHGLRSDERNYCQRQAHSEGEPKLSVSMWKRISEVSPKKGG
ncbi:hypothetical protein Tco_1124153 [Tanacetum coccineum]|uniref:Uncharacterized protein n=1 Tax=Tanacetum coccineum TaxID=301880 RepID=A0ABQ5J854_9ASTR